MAKSEPVDRGKQERAEAARQARAERAAKVREAVAAHTGPKQVRTSRGDVTLGAVTVADDDETGATIVEVTVGDTPKATPDYRIINPPVEVVDEDGTRRQDPLAALAEVVALYRGNPRSRRP